MIGYADVSTPLKVIKEDVLSSSVNSPIIQSPTIIVDFDKSNDKAATPLPTGKQKRKGNVSKRNIEKITSDRITIEGSPMCSAMSRTNPNPNYNLQSVTKHFDKKRDLHNTPASFKHTSFSPNKPNMTMHIDESNTAPNSPMSSTSPATINPSDIPLPLSIPVVLSSNVLINDDTVKMDNNNIKTNNTKTKVKSNIRMNTANANANANINTVNTNTNNSTNQSRTPVLIISSVSNHCENTHDTGIMCMCVYICRLMTYEYLYTLFYTYLNIYIVGYICMQVY